MTHGKYISYKDIAGHLKIRKGEILLIASDITRLAFLARRKEGGFDINELIDSFQKQLGPSGTLIFPAYNFNLKDHSSFDIKRTGPITGALSMGAFKRDDFCRTQHPLHSFLAWGKDSEYLCELKNKSSFGEDSPFAFLYRQQARMLLIGTSVGEAFTFTHYVEEFEKVGYRSGKNYHIKYKDPAGHEEIREYELYKKKPGWTMALHKLQQLFDNKVMQTEFINGAEFNLIDLKPAFEIIQNDIRQNKARNIAVFDLKLMVKDLLKALLLKFRLYTTPTERIANDPDLR